MTSKRGSRRRCQYIRCLNVERYCPGKKFFRFPNPEKKPNLFKKWVLHCGNSMIVEGSYTNRKICMDHFTPNDFLKPNYVRLRKDAIPVNHCTVIKNKTNTSPSHAEGEENPFRVTEVVRIGTKEDSSSPSCSIPPPKLDHVGFKLVSDKIALKSGSRRRCQYIGCKNVQRYCPGKSFFQFPNRKKRPDLFKKWVLHCGREMDAEESFAYRKICVDHFKQSDFQNPVTSRLHKYAAPIHHNALKKVENCTELVTPKNTSALSCSIPPCSEAKYSMGNKERITSNPRKACSSTSQFTTSFADTSRHALHFQLKFTTTGITKPTTVRVVVIDPPTRKFCLATNQNYSRTKADKIKLLETKRNLAKKYIVSRLLKKSDHAENYF